MGSIYKITNTVNGKSYIGQTIHDAEKTRIRDHLKDNNRGSQLVRLAVKKYGRDAFAYEILHDGIIPEFLDTLEKEAIKKFNTVSPHGYNLTTGGVEHEVLSETRQKISKALSGVSKPPTRGMLGKRHTKASRKKMSDSHQGKKLSKEHRKNISVALKGKKPSNFEILHSKASREKSGLALRGRSRPKEVVEKSSIAQRNPYYEDMYNFYRSLPSDMDISEKREKLHKKNLGFVARGSLNRWIRKWYNDEFASNPPRKLSETHCLRLSKTNKGRKHTPESRRNMSEAHKSQSYTPARELFFSLSESLTLKQKRKILLKKYSSDVSPSTIRRWVRKWQSELD